MAARSRPPSCSTISAMSAGCILESFWWLIRRRTLRSSLCTGSTASHEMSRCGKSRPDQVGHASPGALHPEAAQQPAGPDVDTDQEQLAVLVLELEVVDPDHAAAVGVDDLLVEHVARQPDLAVDVRVWLERRCGDVEAELTTLPGADGPPVDGGRQLLVTTPDRHRRDHRVGLLHAHDQVAHGAHRLLVDVDHVGAQEVAEEDHGERDGATWSGWTSQQGTTSSRAAGMAPV